MIFLKERESNMFHLHAKRTLGLVTAAALVISCFTACGGISDEEVISTADGFLTSAESQDLDQLSNYASKEIIDTVGWSDDDINAVINDLFIAIGGYGISEDELLAIPEVQEAVNTLISQYKTVIVTSHTVNNTVTKDDKGSHVTASVTGFSEEDFYSLLDDELMQEVTEFSSNYATEHAEEISEDSEQNMYKALVPFLMDKLTERLNSRIASKDPANWNITVNKVNGKTLVTDVSIEN